jgi:hypothetical protein
MREKNREMIRIAKVSAHGAVPPAIRYLSCENSPDSPMVYGASLESITTTKAANSGRNSHLKCFALISYSSIQPGRLIFA